MVEAAIRYLPLYPDDAGVVFDEDFLLRSENLLPALLPEYAQLAEVIRVIDVTAQKHNQPLQILMNAEQNLAVAVFMPST